jgi:prevent-host-death family protein
MNVTVAEMKANLSEILRKAAAGEDIVVTRHGKPYVKVSAEKPVERLPRIGAFKDKPFFMADDFDELGPEWDEYMK